MCNLFPKIDLFNNQLCGSQNSSKPCVISSGSLSPQYSGWFSLTWVAWLFAFSDYTLKMWRPAWDVLPPSVLDADSVQTLSCCSPIPEAASESASTVQRPVTPPPGRVSTAAANHDKKTSRPPSKIHHYERRTWPVVLWGEVFAVLF